jgi:hypothetical protein
VDGPAIRPAAAFVTPEDRLDHRRNRRRRAHRRGDHRRPRPRARVESERHLQRRGLSAGPRVLDVATLVGTDAYWVQVSVPVSELGWFKIPGVNGDDGSVVDVRQRRGDRTLTWKGQVLRLLGEVDPIGRMARVLVEIRDPLGQRPEGLAEGERAPPILVGSYVEVAISAREVDKAFAVPRSALRDGDQVFVMNGSGKLEIRPVDIAWRRPTDVLVIGGLAAGDRLITSPIPAPVAGMTLRVKGESEQAAKAADAAPGDEKPETVEAN